MDNENFRREAHKMVDWMADYLESIEDYPVRSGVEPGEIAAKLPLAPPQESEAMQQIFADFQKDVMPGITHWRHPSFFAYFNANSSPPSVRVDVGKNCC